MCVGCTSIWEYWATNKLLWTWKMTIVQVCLHCQGRFSIAEGLHVSGKSPGAIQCLCRDVLQCATYYQRLSDFAEPRQPSSLEEFGLVMESFRSGLGRFLQHYRAFVLAVPKSDVTLLQLSVMLRKVIVQIRYVSTPVYFQSQLSLHCSLLSPCHLLWPRAADIFPSPFWHIKRVNQTA